MLERVKMLEGVITYPGVKFYVRWCEIPRKLTLALGFDLEI